MRIESVRKIQKSIEAMKSMNLIEIQKNIFKLACEKLRKL